MLTLRPTKILAKRVHLVLDESAPATGTNVYADWCVHGFQIGRTQHLLFTHTASLLSAAAPARSVTTSDALVRCFREAIGAQLERCGYTRIWGRFVAPELTAVQFLAIPNRSVMGSMNDLIWLTQCWAEELTLDEVNRKLVDVPMSAIDPPQPYRVFESLAQ